MVRRAMLAMVIFAATLASPADAKTSLALLVDPDGTSHLWNRTGGPLSFDLYSLKSQGNQLDPAGWNSIADQVATNEAGVIAALGSGGLTFHEFGPVTAGRLEEQTFFIDRGILSANAMFSIGKPFAVVPSSSDTTAEWRRWGTFFPEPMDIVYVPEPATVLLAALAGAGLLASRAKYWRRSRQTG